jgi:hypothetical protein
MTNGESSDWGKSRAQMDVSIFGCETKETYSVTGKLKDEKLK